MTLGKATLNEIDFTVGKNMDENFGQKTGGSCQFLFIR